MKSEFKEIVIKALETGYLVLGVVNADKVSSDSGRVLREHAVKNPIEAIKKAADLLGVRISIVEPTETKDRTKQ